MEIPTATRTSHFLTAIFRRAHSGFFIATPLFSLFFPYFLLVSLSFLPYVRYFFEAIQNNVSCCNKCTIQSAHPCHFPGTPIVRSGISLHPSLVLGKKCIYEIKAGHIHCSYAALHAVILALISSSALSAFVWRSLLSRMRFIKPPAIFNISQLDLN